MNILYMDCFSGISGNMLLSAFIDAGLPIEHLSAQFKLVNLPEFQGITVEKVIKGNISSSIIKFKIKKYGEHKKIQSPDQSLAEILLDIETSNLSTFVRTTSLEIFQLFTDALIKIKNQNIADVFIQDIDGINSILEIIGVVIGLEYFQIHSVFSSAVPLGTGLVNTKDGLLPIPTPVTLELFRMAKMPVTESNAKFSLVTPLGAAILARLATFHQPDMNLELVGVGAGLEDLEWPNVLRLMIGTTREYSGAQVEIETNIDDMNPQLFGLVMAKLFKAGALDVYFTPIYMKKNRPATKLSVIARKKDELALSNLILLETSTLGVRVSAIWHHHGDWELSTIETKYGAIPIKCKTLKGVIIQTTPEFDTCVQISDKIGIPVNLIIQEVLSSSILLINTKIIE